MASDLVSRLRAVQPFVNDPWTLKRRTTNPDGDEAADSIERLQAALRRSMLAIDDWLNTYAVDMCDPDRVAEARARIGKVGTLAYIADVQDQNRNALRSQDKGEG